MKVLKKSSTNMESTVASYNAIREQEKTLKGKKTELAQRIKDDAFMNGTKDSSGNYYVDGEDFIWGLQIKKSYNLDQEKALKFLEENGYEDCIKTVQVVDEDKLQKYLADEDITKDELVDMSNYKEVESVYVKKKEEMPEVEQTTLRAAQKKRK